MLWGGLLPLRALGFETRHRTVLAACLGEVLVSDCAATSRTKVFRRYRSHVPGEGPVDASIFFNV